MTTYTDEEVLDFLNQQEQNFKSTANGSGFNAKEARAQLVKLSLYSKEERLLIARESLSNFNLNK